MKMDIKQKLLPQYLEESRAVVTSFNFGLPKNLEIPEGIMGIGDNAFKDCTLIESVSIPGTVDRIGNDAFAGCKNLKKVVIKDGVNSICAGAFCNCTALESVAIGEGVERIELSVFYNCENLTNITLPSTLKEILQFDLNASIKIPAIEKLNYNGTLAQWCAMNWNEVLVSKAKNITLGDGTDLRTLTTLSIPDSVTEIGVNAFYNCKSLTTVTIPNSVKTIGFQAFEGCTSLTDITIPSSVMEIAFNAFLSCKSLKNVKFSDTTGWHTMGGWKNKREIPIDDISTMIHPPVTNLDDPNLKYYSDRNWYYKKLYKKMTKDGQ